MGDASDQRLLDAAFPDSPPPYRARPVRDRFTRFMRIARYGYPTLLRASGRRASYAVVRDTDLVIDGFARSANTFVTVQAVLLNPTLAIAHHGHAVSQFTAAERLHVPAVLLVRDPLEAVASVRAGWQHWSPGASAIDDVRYWIRFHERVMRWAPSSTAVRVSDLQADLARVEADKRFDGITLTSSSVDAGYVSEMVRWVEERRGDRGTVDRSSSRDVRSERRETALDELTAEVPADEIARARECHARVIETLGA